MRTAALAAATWSTGLVAGLFAAFAIAVMPGLRSVGDATFVEAMQRINVAIVNPLFLLLFLGSPALLAAAVLVSRDRTWWVVALLLAVVSLTITFTINIPLNDALAAAGPTDPSSAREAFERGWTIAHTLRTLLLCVSFAACLVAISA